MWTIFNIKKPRNCEAFQYPIAFDCNFLVLISLSVCKYNSYLFFKAYPVSEKVFEFIINLAKHIRGIQIYVGEVEEIENIYKANNIRPSENIISKEHPAFDYYPGIKEDRVWMFPSVTGYHPSFFSYWKKCERYLK